MRRSLSIKRKYTATKQPCIEFASLKYTEEGVQNAIPTALAVSEEFIVVGNTSGVIQIWKDGKMK